MAALAGPIGDFPLNDDWEYGSAAIRLATSGELHIAGPSVADAVSQVAWGALFCLPFQCSFTVLRFSTLALGLIGILALYALIRELGGDRRTALIASMALAVNPLWFALANTFMTDVPFVALSIVAMYLFVRGFRRPSQWSLWAGLAASLIALLDRQLAIVLLAGFAVAYPARFGHRPASVIMSLTPFLLGLILHYAFHRWMISTGRAPGLRSSGSTYLMPASVGSLFLASAKLTVNVAPYLGLFILPSIISWRRGIPRRVGLIGIPCGVVALVPVVALWRGRAIPALGNVILASGFGPLTIRGAAPAAHPLIAAVWFGATALGAYAIWLALCRFVLFARSLWLQRRLPSRENDWLLPFFVTILLAYWLLICTVSFNNGFFDRYLIFLIPLELMLMCTMSRPGPASRDVFALVLLLLFGFVSVAGTHDYLAWNRARWVATDFLIEKQGVAPARVDGGYEFNELAFYKSHQDDRENVDALHYKDIYPRWFADADYVIAFAPIAGYDQLFQFPYTRWLPPGRSAILVLRKRV